YDRERDRATVGRSVPGFGPQQRDVECPGLRWRQAQVNLIHDVAQQVAERRERELRLGFDGLAAEHAVGPLPGRLQASPPQRGLADPGLTGEEQCDRTLVGVVEELRDRG